MVILNTITILENESCLLSSEDAAIAEKMIQANPEWNCTIEDNYVEFGQYMIGSVIIGNTAIEIKPRNRAFTLDRYLEMMLYVNTDIFSNQKTTGYKKNAGFSLIQIAEEYLKECKKLIKFGITGSYICSKRSCSKMHIKGQCSKRSKYSA